MLAFLLALFLLANRHRNRQQHKDRVDIAVEHRVVGGVGNEAVNRFVQQQQGCLHPELLLAPHNAPVPAVPNPEREAPEA